MLRHRVRCLHGYVSDEECEIVSPERFFVGENTMRRMNGTLGALAAFALSSPIVVSAQVPARVTADPPGSDRAGKLLGSDTAPPEPAPAPGTRFARDPAARINPDAANLAATRANAVAAPGVVPPPVIGSHQIDRYDAIDKLQKSVEADPKALNDWIILGELAHEVAMDSPADTAGRYFTMSSDAFQSALKLDPNNAGLKAAVQFAKDQAKNADTFEKSRDKYTDTFLDARRRDLAATSHTPYVRMYEPPIPTRNLPSPNPGSAYSAPRAPTGPINDVESPAVSVAPSGRPGAPLPGDSASPTVPIVGSGAPPATPAAAAARVRATGDRAIDSATPLVNPSDTPVAEAAPAVTPALTNAPMTDASNYGTRQNYSAAGSLAAAPIYFAGPSYRPFATVGGSPYTYEQFSTNYFPSVVNSNPAVQPVTTQRYSSSVVTPNAFEQRLMNRATATGAGLPAGAVVTPRTGVVPGTVVAPGTVVTPVPPVP